MYAYEEYYENNEKEKAKDKETNNSVFLKKNIGHK